MNKQVSPVYFFDESMDSNPLELIVSREFRHVINQDDSEYELHTKLAEKIEGNQMFLDDPYKNLSEIFIKKKLRTKVGNIAIPPFLNFFTAASNKEQVLKDVALYIGQIKFAKRIEHEITLVSDELISNVLYNRSCNDLLVPKENKVPRKVVAKFAGQFGVFFIFTAGLNIHVGCIDPFGNLDHNKSICQLLESTRQGVAETIKKGFGIGLSVIYERCNSILMVVENNSKTLISLKIPLRGPIYKHKTIHYMNKEI